MGQGDLLKRYLEAGMALTQLTRARAERLVKELVTAGEVQADHAQHVVDDLLERGRKSTDRLADTIRAEVANQVAGLGLATKEEVAALRAEVAAVQAATGTAPPPAPAAKVALKKALAKKTAAKKAAAKKTPAKKAVTPGRAPAVKKAVPGVRPDPAAPGGP